MNRIFQKLRMGRTAKMMLIAAIVGLLAALGNVIFVRITDASNEFFMVFIARDLLAIGEAGWHRFLLPIIPVLGALLLVPLSLGMPGLVNGYGFPKFLAEVHLNRAQINPFRLIANTLGAAITIGSGGSAGREGPIAQIGGTLGSIVSRLFRLSLKRTQVLVGCGVAGAISATFNAPIAGVLFAEEIVFLGQLKLNTFSLFVISSVTASAVSHQVLGHASIFSAPDYQLGSPLELPLYGLLGIVIGLAAAAYKKVYYASLERFSRLPLHPQLKPVLGALAVGCIGLGFRDVLGDGYHVIHGLINNSYVETGIFLLLALTVLKMLATSLTLGSGGAGGLFAPSLFIGAALGAACGQVFSLLFPELQIHPGAFAVVGMGALLSAATHAPLTSVFLLLEITSGYSVTIPILLAAIIGTTVSEKLFHDSIDTHYFSLNNIPIEQARELAALEPYSVGMIMSPPVAPVRESDTVPAFIDQMADRNMNHVPVCDDTDVVTGIVSLTDVRSFMFQDQMWRLLVVSDVMRDDVIHLHETDSIQEALIRFEEHELEDLPVLDRQNHLKGMLNRGDLMTFIRKRTILDQSYESPISEL